VETDDIDGLRIEISDFTDGTEFKHSKIAKCLYTGILNVGDSYAINLDKATKKS
jgi:hypothetical protein